MSVEVHKVIVHRFLREAFEQGALNQVSNGPGARPGMLPGPDTNYRQVFPNRQDAIDEQTAEGNTVVIAGLPAERITATWWTSRRPVGRLWSSG
jgi:hypothetical protein